jgi:hypothetical protein
MKENDTVILFKTEQSWKKQITDKSLMNTFKIGDTVRLKTGSSEMLLSISSAAPERINLYSLIAWDMKKAMLSVNGMS